MSEWTSHEEMEQNYMPPGQDFGDSPHDKKPNPAPEPTTGPFAPIDADTPNSHVHKWETLDIWHPVFSNHPQLRTPAVTIVLVRCRVCEIPQTIELKGTWTLQQILQKGKDHEQ